MISLIIHGETPAKKNSKIITRQGRLIPSKRYSQWHVQAMQEVDIQCRRFDPIEEEVAITLTFYHGDQVRRDSDNGTSSVLDLLTDCGILADDRWQIVRELNVRNFYDKNNARCEIEIKKLNQKGL